MHKEDQKHIDYCNIQKVITELRRTHDSVRLGLSNNDEVFALVIESSKANVKGDRVNCSVIKNEIEIPKDMFEDFEFEEIIRIINQQIELSWS